MRQHALLTLTVTSLVAVSAAQGAAQAKKPAPPKPLTPLVAQPACSAGVWLKPLRKQADPLMTCESARFLETKLAGKKLLVIAGERGGNPAGPTPAANIHLAGKWVANVDELVEKLRLKKLDDRTLLDVLTIALLAAAGTEVAFDAASASALWEPGVPENQRKLRGRAGLIVNDPAPSAPPRYLVAFVHSATMENDMLCEKVSRWRVWLVEGKVQSEAKEVAVGAGCQI